MHAVAVGRGLAIPLLTQESWITEVFFCGQRQDPGRSENEPRRMQVLGLICETSNPMRFSASPATPPRLLIFIAFHGMVEHQDEVSSLSSRQPLQSPRHPGIQRDPLPSPVIPHRIMLHLHGADLVPALPRPDLPLAPGVGLPVRAPDLQIV